MDDLEFIFEELKGAKADVAPTYEEFKKEVFGDENYYQSIVKFAKSNKLPSDNIEIEKNTYLKKKSTTTTSTPTSTVSTNVSEVSSPSNVKNKPLIDLGGSLSTTSKLQNKFGVQPVAPKATNTFIEAAPQINAKKPAVEPTFEDLTNQLPKGESESMRIGNGEKLDKNYDPNEKGNIYSQYEFAQKQYKKANEKIEQYKQDANPNWENPLSAIPSIYRNLTNDPAQYDKDKKEFDLLKAEADQSREKMTALLDKDVDRLYKTYGDKLMNFSVTGMAVPDMENIENVARAEADKHGLTENYFYNTLKTKLAARAQFEYIKPQIEKEFAKEFKKANGVELKDAYNKDYEKAFPKVAEIDAEANLQLESIGKSIGEEVKIKQNEFATKYKQASDILNQHVAQDPDIIALKQAMFQQQAELVQSGQITEEEADKNLRSPENVAKINELAAKKYGKQYDEIYSEYLKNSNAISTKYKNRFQRQQDEVLKMANAKRKAYINSTEYTQSPELKSKIEVLNWVLDEGEDESEA